MIETMGRKDFAKHLDTEFRVNAAHTHVVLKLAAVNGDESHTESGWEHFSLHFVAREGAPLPQSIYPFDHDSLGAFDMFIVPVKQDAEGVHYEAIFNRTRD